MRIIRYQLAGQEPQYGWVQGELVGPLEGDPFGAFRRGEAKTALKDVRLLTPVLPGKIICVGRNYAEHARELGNDVPKYPLIFLKPPTSLIPSGEEIVLPPQSNQVEHEAELVVVIGKKGRHIDAAQAKKHILGYAVGNDVTARDLQKTDGQWTRAKGFDTFCVFGPWVDTDFDIADALITCKVSGQPRQMGSTRDMIFTVPTLIAYISSIMTLQPGDVIFTGTPSGVGPLQAGDEVVAAIEGLGELRNPVRAE